MRVQTEALPGVFTVDDAVEAESYIPYSHSLHRGDVDAALKVCGDRVVTGTMTVPAARFRRPLVSAFRRL